MFKKTAKIIVSLVLMLVLTSSLVSAGTITGEVPHSYNIQTVQSKLNSNLVSVYFNPTFQCDYAIFSYMLNGVQENVYMSRSTLMSTYGWVYHNVPSGTEIKITYFKTGDAQYEINWKTPTSSPTSPSTLVQIYQNASNSSLVSVYFNPTFNCDYAILSYLYNGKQENVYMSRSTLLTTYGWVQHNVPKGAQIKVTYYKTGDAQYETGWKSAI